MDSRWYFADVRWASARLEEVERLIEAQGEDWKKSKGSAPRLVNDPTGSTALRHIAAVEELVQERESLVFLISEALAIIAGVGMALGEKHMQVLHAFYIECEPWGRVSEMLGMSRRNCLRIRDTALDWIDSVGFAHAKDGTGYAEV